MERKDIIILVASVSCVLIACGTALLRITRWNSTHSETVKNPASISMPSVPFSSQLTSQAAFVLNPYVLEPPDTSVCEDAKKRALAGLDDKQITKVQSVIHYEHSWIEDQFIDGIYKTLADPDSPYWERWEHLGAIQTVGSSEMFLNTQDGATIIADLEQVRAVEPDARFESDLSRMQQLIRDAVQNHDLNDLIAFHKMIHDFDYWVVSYPRFLSIRVPGSPRGICYFGALGGLADSADSSPGKQ